ncbi:pyrroline-5-carboxylate reductase [Bacillota bacterium LX-D]|nr:pyrroline-5-carboxylate reductase [Bacillota bacterium LX-D]
MKVGLIGGGKISEAVISGVIGANFLTGKELLVSEPDQARAAYLVENYQVAILKDNQSAAASADILILAVKPQIIKKVLTELNSVLEPGKLVISMVAGIPLALLEEFLPHSPVIRVMPNTPCLIGKGISAFSLGSKATEEDQAVAQKILIALGETICLPETMLDAVTAVSGSGPAYVYLFIEAFIDAGVKIGLPRDIAQKLVLQTILGSTELVSKTGKHPAELKDMVTSPGGTTISALCEMEKSGFRASIFNGVMAAEQKSKDLSK